MAVSLKIRVGYLLAEFLADALVFGGSGQSAGAIATLCLQSLFDCFNNLGIFI